ncbi:MAG: aspartate aminotransferase family protein [Eubacterium sp.]|nr:aspartate aminotransferase family protein [Eubacterium sp.]
MSIKELDSRYIAHSYGRFDAVLTEGKGSVLYDENGKRYIDMTAGIGVNAFGIADAAWVSAVTAQLGKLQHISNLYYTEPCALLAEALCQKTGMKRVFFANSGAEANEGMIKFARKYSFDKYGEGRKTIITLTDSFHGRTVTTLAATGQEEFHTVFAPFTEGFVYCPANDCAALRSLITPSVCGILFEPVQGEGGVNNMTQAFADCLASVAAENDILLLADEVQTGNGRTGKYFAYEHYGLTPDIVSTAKGLGGGLPIGAVLFGDKVKDTVTPGSHGSTFGGNPVAAAGALSIVQRIDDALLQEVTAKGDYIHQQLAAMTGVTALSGLGLMIGISTPFDAAVLAQKCLEKGLLVLTAHKNKVRLLPALNITYQEIDEGLAILGEVLEHEASA